LFAQDTEACIMLFFDLSKVSMNLTDKICWKCVTDEGLRRRIRRGAQRDLCALCGTKRASRTIEEIAKIVDPIFREFFGPGEYERRYSAIDDGYWEEREGDDLSTILRDVVGEIDFEDELIDALIAGDNYWPPDGEEQFYGRDINYRSISYRSAFSLEEWLNLHDQIKYSRRYFSDDAKRLFDQLFADIETQYVHANGGRTPIIRTLSAGQIVWRARLCGENSEAQKFLQKPDAELGPPPKGKARAGRMNAPGVSVFYGAFDEKTCIAEMRPSIGAQTVVGRFEITRPLNVLDFNLLEKVWEKLGYFDANFRLERDRSRFLRRLHDLICLPVLPGKDEDYLITQTLAEYLAHVHRAQLDGLLFRSTQHIGGINVVLFFDPSSEGWYQRDSGSRVLPVTYVEKSACIFATKGISYENEKVGFVQYGDTVRVFDDGNDF
jgi:hypothetical protein